MTEYICLSIDDYPFSTRVAWIPFNGLPSDLKLELQTMKQYEDISLMVQSPDEPQMPGCWHYIPNPMMPYEVYQSVLKWKDIIENKPHVIGPGYLSMSMDDIDHDGFIEYQEELTNNLPDWYHAIKRERPPEGNIFLNIFINNGIN